MKETTRKGTALSQSTMQGVKEPENVNNSHQNATVVSVLANYPCCVKKAECGVEKFVTPF